MFARQRVIDDSHAASQRRLWDHAPVPPELLAMSKGERWEMFVDETRKLTHVRPLDEEEFYLAPCARHLSSAIAGYLERLFPEMVVFDGNVWCDVTQQYVGLVEVEEPPPGQAPGVRYRDRDTA